MHHTSFPREGNLIYTTLAYTTQLNIQEEIWYLCVSVRHVDVTTITIKKQLDKIKTMFDCINIRIARYIS